MGYPFFGLTAEYSIQLHELIFDLCHYGEFGYDAVYTMPVQYRTFYIKKLLNIKEKERERHAKEMGQMDAPSSSKVVRGPPINRS